MKRWTARGIVESKKLPVGGTVYRIKTEHRNKPLGHIVWEYNQAPVQKTFPNV